MTCFEQIKDNVCVESKRNIEKGNKSFAMKIEARLEPIHVIGRIFRMEYLMWDKNSKKLCINRKFRSKFSIVLHIFAGKLFIVIYVFIVTILASHYHQYKMFMQK